MIVMRILRYIGMRNRKQEFPRWIQPDINGPIYFQLENTHCVGKVQPFVKHYGNGNTDIGAGAYYENEQEKVFALLSDAKAYIESKYKQKVTK